jgi:hypothetical protein
MEAAVLRGNALLANLVFLPASFFACQAGTFRDPGMVLQCSPGTAVEPNSASLVLELDRAVLVLKRGLKENWRTRDEYLTAFEKTPSTDLTGRAVTDAKNYVACTIGAQLRTHQIWDEGPPIEVEVDRAITEFSKWRDEAEQARTAKARSSNQEGYAAEHQPRP